MVTQGILDFLASVWTTVWNHLISLIPSPPSWWTSIDTSAVGSFFTTANHWLPIGLALAVGGTVLSMRLVAAAIMLARRVLSLFTGGGGNA